MTTKGRKRTAKRTPAKPKTPTVPAGTKLPTLDLRNRRPFITEIQTQAALAAALLGVTYTRIAGWQHQDDGTVRYAMPSGAGLTYNPNTDIPLTAWTPCPQRVRHAHPIATRQDLLAAQIEAARCTQPHGHLTADQADAAANPPTLNVHPSGTQTIPIPVPQPVKPTKVLADVLAKPDTRNADTQATDVTALRAAAADDTAKEHPDHD